MASKRSHPSSDAHDDSRKRNKTEAPFASASSSSHKNSTSTSATVHPSRREQVPKRNKNDTSRRNPLHPRPAPKTTALNPLKSRIRDLKRLLAHADQDDAERGTSNKHAAAASNRSARRGNDDADGRNTKGINSGMPADVRIGHERELASLSWELEQARLKEMRAKMVGRWHMVRFFERRKAERRLKKLQRRRKDKGARAEDGEKGEKEEVRAAEVDLNYTLYFPLDRPYVSLWPRENGAGMKKKDRKNQRSGAGGDGEEDEDQDGGGGDGDDQQGKGDREMWVMVERCMRQGTLDDLRNGKVVEGLSAKLAMDGRSKSEASKKKSDGRLHAPRSTGAPADQDDEESDDGFFE